MKKTLRKFTALFLAVLLCLCPLSAQAAGVTGETALASYHTLIDTYNNFADLHEAYLSTLGDDEYAADSVRSYYSGVNLVLDNLYASSTAKEYFDTLDIGTLTEINNILTEDIAFMNAASAAVQAQMTNGYPAGNYKLGTVYGPKLNQSELNEVAAVVSRFDASLPLDGMSDIDKVMAARDYLIQFCSYAPDWSKNQANTAWGALVYHEAQCSGYARAMKALCDSMGIDCRYVHADKKASNSSHQWNTVKIDGQWYIIDVQGDDSSGFEAFFLLSDDTYANDTGLSWDRTSVPACPANYTGVHYHYVFYQRMDQSLFGARMI